MTTVAYLSPKLLSKETWVIKDKILVTLFFVHALSGIL
jgi:hypothetical protein